MRGKNEHPMKVVGRAHTVVPDGKGELVRSEVMVKLGDRVLGPHL